MTEQLPAARAHRAGAGEKDRLDLLHAGGHRDHDRKHAVADAERDLRGAPMPKTSTNIGRIVICGRP